MITGHCIHCDKELNLDGTVLMRAKLFHYDKNNVGWLSTIEVICCDCQYSGSNDDTEEDEDFIYTDGYVQDDDELDWIEPVFPTCYYDKPI